MNKIAIKVFMMLFIIILGIIISISFLILFSSVFVSSCACETIEPGYVGIKVNMYGDGKGVEDIPLRTGMVWYNLFTENVYEFPTFLQTQVWTKDETEGSPTNEEIVFNGREGAVLSVDVMLAYSVIAEKVPSIFKEFRKPIEDITRIYLRSQVRDCIVKYGAEYSAVDIFGVKKAEFLEKVRKDLKERMSPKGFNIDSVSIVGSIRADDSVMKSINAVITASQRAIEADNKIKEAEAVAKQQIAEAEGNAKIRVINANAQLESSKAQAEANRILSQSLSQQIVQWEAIKRWNGVLPQATSGGIPLINLK